MQAGFQTLDCRRDRESENDLKTVALVSAAVTSIGCRYLSYWSASTHKCLSGCVPKSQVMAPATVGRLS